MSVTTRRSQALRQFATYVTELDRILYLSIQGMFHVAGSVELAVAVSEYERYLDPALDAEAEEKRLEEVRLRATFAQEEMERGYPVLHAHSVVALWGALETLIFNLTVAWIRDDPTVLSDERLSSIKISLAESHQPIPMDVLWHRGEVGGQLIHQQKLGVPPEVRR